MAPTEECEDQDVTTNGDAQGGASAIADVDTDAAADASDALVDPWQEYVRNEANASCASLNDAASRADARAREIRVPLTAGAGYEFRKGHKTNFPDVVTWEGETDQRAAFRVASERRSAGVEAFKDGTVCGTQQAVDIWGQGLLALQRLRNLKKYQPPRATTLPTPDTAENLGRAGSEAADFVPGVDPTEWEIDTLSVTLRLNIAQGMLKLREYESCINYCDAALEIDPKSTKALWRKAKAVWGLRNPGEARDCLYTLLTYEPDNAAAKQLLQDIDAEEEKKRSKRVGPRPRRYRVESAVAPLCSSDGAECAECDVASHSEDAGMEEDMEEKEAASVFACCRRRHKAKLY